MQNFESTGPALQNAVSWAFEVIRDCTYEIFKISDMINTLISVLLITKALCSQKVKALLCDHILSCSRKNLLVVKQH